MEKQYIYYKVYISGNKEDQLKHTLLVIYIQNPQAARKDRLIASSYNQLLDHVVHLRMPAETTAVSFSAFCKQILFNNQTFAFSILQCMQPYIILFYVVVKCLEAHNYHILGCLSNISKKNVKPVRKEDARGHQSSPGISHRPVITLKHMER